MVAGDDETGDVRVVFGRWLCDGCCESCLDHREYGSTASWYVRLVYHLRDKCGIGFVDTERDAWAIIASVLPADRDWWQDLLLGRDIDRWVPPFLCWTLRTTQLIGIVSQRRSGGRKRPSSIRLSRQPSGLFWKFLFLLHSSLSYM